MKTLIRISFIKEIVQRKNYNPENSSDRYCTFPIRFIFHEILQQDNYNKI